MTTAIAVGEGSLEQKIGDLYQHAMGYVSTENWDALLEFKRTLDKEDFLMLRSFIGEDGLTLGEVISSIWEEKDASYNQLLEARITWQGDKKSEHHSVLHHATDASKVLRAAHLFEPIKRPLPCAESVKLEKPFPF